MNWFERHLNWTAVIFALSGLVFLYLILVVSLGFDYLGWLNIYDLGIPRSVWINVIFIAGFVFLALPFGWVLCRKQRSPSFLILFSLAPVVWLLLVVPPISDLVNQFRSTPVLVTWVLLFYVVTWIILLILKSSEKPRSNMLTQLFVSTRCTWRVIMMIVTIIIITSLSSGVFIKFGQLSYTSPENTGWYHPWCSFYYPADFSYPDFAYIDPDGYTPRQSNYDGRFVIYLERFLDSAPYGRIHVGFISAEKKKQLLASSDNQSSTSNGESVFEDKTNITVDGYPATQIVRVYQYNLNGNITTRSSVSIFLNHSEGQWYLSWDSKDCEVYQPPDYFTRLLESFTIYDD